MMETTVGGLLLKNPLILASGILSHGSLLKKAAEHGAGAVVTKSLTLEPREGYPTPVIVGFEGGLINAVGLANPGCVEYLESELPIAKEGGVPVIVSLAGTNEEEFRRMAEMVAEHGGDAVELNMSCPHVKRKGIELGSDPEIVGEIVKKVCEVGLPVWVKLGVCDRMVESAVAAEKEGASAIVAINTLRAMVIDIESKRPVLSNVFGGVSGPSLKPIALRCVYELYEELSIPIIGCGGVTTWRDVVEFLLAGASAVQVGSALAVKDLGIFRELQQGVKNYLVSNGFKRLEEIVGLAHP